MATSKKKRSSTKRAATPAANTPASKPAARATAAGGHVQVAVRNQAGRLELHEGFYVGDAAAAIDAVKELQRAQGVGAPPAIPADAATES